MGTGVFDGMMAYWNGDHFYVHRSREHLERFRRHAAKMGLAFSWSVLELEDAVRELLSRAAKRTTYVRPIAFRAAPQLFLTGSEHLPVDVCMFGVYANRDCDLPLRCQLSTVERVSGRAMPVAWKVCGVYVNSYVCRRAAEEAGFDDGIMSDDTGRIAEASAANVIFLQGDCVITPRLTPEIFPGVTRAHVLELAVQLGREVIEREIRPEELASFDGALLCATLMELRPISCISHVEYATSQNPHYRALVDAFRDVTHS